MKERKVELVITCLMAIILVLIFELAWTPRVRVTLPPEPCDFRSQVMILYPDGSEYICRETSTWKPFPVSEWSGETTYQTSSVVLFEGKRYIALKSNTAERPDSGASWRQLPEPLHR